MPNFSEFLFRLNFLPCVLNALKKEMKDEQISTISLPLSVRTENKRYISAEQGETDPSPLSLTALKNKKGRNRTASNSTNYERLRMSEHLCVHLVTVVDLALPHYS